MFLRHSHYYNDCGLFAWSNILKEHKVSENCVSVLGSKGGKAPTQSGPLVTVNLKQWILSRNSVISNVILERQNPVKMKK
jgi:hypothetical protein